MTIPVAPFRCDVIPERDRVRVAPAGELDLATAPQFARTIEELLASGFDHVVVDLTSLDFIDSSGIHLLLSLQDSADAGRVRLRLRPGPPSVQRRLELTGVLNRFDVIAPARSPRRIWTA